MSSRGRRPVHIYYRRRLDALAFGLGLVARLPRMQEKIARTCGYMDRFQFSRACKRLFGYAPTHLVKRDDWRSIVESKRAA